MEAEAFDEEAFFAALDRSAVRVLLIGRRAMRDKDVADIRLLEGLKHQRGG